MRENSPRQLLASRACQLAIFSFLAMTIFSAYNFVYETRQILLPYMAITQHDIFLAGQPLETDRTTRMQLISTDTNFSA